MSVVGYIDDQGHYHKGVFKNTGHDRNNMYQSWSHDQQRKEFSKETIQPHIGNKPNPEFVKNYPEYSHLYWSQAEIDKALREQI